MTNATESLELTRVGTGTPMGALNAEVLASGAGCVRGQAGREPVRLMLSGEADRVSRQPGQDRRDDHRCPHRCASCSSAATRVMGSPGLSRLEVAPTAFAWRNPICRQTRVQDKVHAKAYQAREQAV